MKAYQTRNGFTYETRHQVPATSAGTARSSLPAPDIRLAAGRQLSICPFHITRHRLNVVRVEVSLESVRNRAETPHALPT